MHRNLSLTRGTGCFLRLGVSVAESMLLCVLGGGDEDRGEEDTPTPLVSGLLPLLVWTCWRTFDETVESSKTGLSMEYEGGGDLLFFLPLFANLRIRLMPLPLLPPLSFVLFLSTLTEVVLLVATEELSPRAMFGGGDTALLIPLTDL